MSFFLNPTLACDYYKIGHPFMQPKDTETVYSTWTARSYKHHPGCPKTVVFGHQYTIQEHLINFFQENFFNQPLDALKEEYEAMIGDNFNAQYEDFSHFEKLHELGYLPLEIWGVPEGTLLPIGIPDHVIFNTHPDFAWLPQYIEDIWSANNWLPSTSATTAYYRYKQLREFTDQMCDNPEMTARDLAGDFSLRGHTSLEAGAISGAAHLLSFRKTATIPANSLIEQYYQDERVGLGTLSLEHSVVEQGVSWFKNRIADGTVPEYAQPYLKQALLSGDWEINLIAEMCFILYLLNEVQPRGVMTYVSDTYDYWGVVSKILPLIKDEIMKRTGCFVVRPDSGNPTKIICGAYLQNGSPESNGTLNMLLNTFGYTINDKGYKVLPRQIRMIYGDAITPTIVNEVGNWCLANGVSIENVSFGIGAYTYQYVTRDTRGYAIKATDCIHKVYGETPIYKQPKTDPGKKSPRGCVVVVKDEAEGYRMVDGLTLQESLEYEGNIMVCKMRDGKTQQFETFDEIQTRLAEEE